MELVAAQYRGRARVLQAKLFVLISALKMVTALKKTGGNCYEFKRT